MTEIPMALSANDIVELNRSFASARGLRVAQNAVMSSELETVALDQEVAARIPEAVSDRLDDWGATNQKQSGRCWLFSALNLLRSSARTNLGVKDFEFSQNYAMYCDKLERANYFLTSVLTTANQPMESRLVSFLFGEILGDGGQWTMAVDILRKYGAMPKQFMPETISSSHTASMNRQLQRVLRHAGLALRSLVASGVSEADLDAARREAVARVHRVLTIHLGTPPESFDWQWRDDEKAFHRYGEITPQQFLAEYVDLDYDNYVCLVDDPRSEHPKDSLLGVEYLGNVVGGSPVRYLNVEISQAKELAKQAIQAGEPVWFGCDVSPMLDRKRGIWDVELFDYSGVYGFDYSLTKEERVRSGDSAMTHAMLFTGVDVAPDGSTRAWRVENSWGTEIADKGFFTMSDAWFDEFVFEVAVPQTRLSEQQRQALTGDALMLPAWDPMGALA